MLSRLKLECYLMKKRHKKVTINSIETRTITVKIAKLFQVECVTIVRVS